MRDLIKKILREEVVDINDIQDELLTMPLVARQKLLDDLNDVVSVDEEYINMDEQISYKGIPEIKAKTTVGKILKWVKRYITDKATNFLINASMNEIKDTFEKVVELAQTHGYGSALKQVLTSEDDCYQHLNIKDFRSSWKGVEDIEAREKFGEKREVMCHDRYDI